MLYEVFLLFILIYDAVSISSCRDGNTTVLKTDQEVCTFTRQLTSDCKTEGSPVYGIDKNLTGDKCEVSSNFTLRCHCMSNMCNSDEAAMQAFIQHHLEADTGCFCPESFCYLYLICYLQKSGFHNRTGALRSSKFHGAYENLLSERNSKKRKYAKSIHSEESPMFFTVVGVVVFIHLLLIIGLIAIVWKRDNGNAKQTLAESMTSIAE
ncbi:hypothetical protein V3C99_014033 [Haemonchus contortus]